MNRQTEKIALIGGGLVAWWLLTRTSQVVPTGNGGGVTTVPGTSQQSGAAEVMGVGKIYKETPPGKTPCKDGTYSDFPGNWRGGVCSYHGGRVTVFVPEPIKNQPTTNRLEVLKNSLVKKEQELERRFANHFADVKRANGQPLNDKRNGQATLNRWENQSDAIRNMQNEIEKTKRAIEIEEDKIYEVEYTKGYLPQIILDMIASGELVQWRKHPNFFFVPGVDKARIVWDEDKKVVSHRYSREITDKAQWAKFAKTFNALAKVLNEKGISGLINRLFGIGAIYPEIPNEFYECSDGTFTDKNSRRACAWHGGLKSGEPIPTGGGGSSFVQDVPLTIIQSKPEWFQNRADAYSTRSVEAIVSAVLEGRFIWSNLDPIQLWKGPGGVLYILSGHSRKEAFKRLSEMGIEYQGRNFDTIPAKVETGLSLEEAQTVARQSNTLSTPETALERAAYYRRLRSTGEFTLRQLEEQAKRTEGRNANKVLAFSFLNPSGKTYAALEAMQTADATSFGNMETIAQWIGNARKSMPMLTNSHENELYEWLVTGGGYGTKSGQINSELAFKSELQKIVMKRTEFGVFNQNEPLNILSARYASPVEQEYNAQVNELKRDIADLEKQKTDALKRYAKDASPEDMRRILAPIEAGLRIKGQELQRLILKRNEILDAAKNQASLFGLRRRWRA